MNFNRERRSLFRAIAQSQRSEHIALAGSSYACTAALQRLCANLVPQIALGLLNFIGFRVCLDFCNNLFNLLHLKVDNVVHYALSRCYVGAERVEVEACLVGKRIEHIRV